MPLTLKRARNLEAHAASAHQFSFRKLDHAGTIDLADMAGSVLLVVNVASACGYTPQYRELETLHAAKNPRGLVVLGVPSNDFGAQERGPESAIRDFCDTAYHITFPMTGKVEILGAGRHPFYQWIADTAGSPALPRWNFHKYLISRQGELIDGFASSVSPLGREMMCAIDQALS